MGINVQVEFEDGSPRSELVVDPNNQLSQILATAQGGLCRFIDPYGDTVFNQRQLPVLQVELEALRAHASGEALAKLDEVIATIYSVLGQAHWYVRFIGD